MDEVTVRLDVRRPVEEVFDYWARPESHLEWQEGLVEATQITGGPVGVGTRFRIVRDLGGRTHHAVFEVSEFVRPRRFGIAATSAQGMIDHRSLVIFEPTEGGTRVSLRVEPTPRGWRRLLTPVIRFVMSRELPKDFARLRVALEGDPGSGDVNGRGDR